MKRGGKYTKYTLLTNASSYVLQSFISALKIAAVQHEAGFWLRFCWTLQVMLPVSGAGNAACVCHEHVSSAGL